MKKWLKTDKKGKLSDCVSELNKYLSIYQCDAEGWFELAEIYLSEYEYEKAAYCFEELIILNPANYIIYQVRTYRRDQMVHIYARLGCKCFYIIKGEIIGWPSS